MAKRVVTKIGDVFCVDFRNGKKGYFQYVVNDMTALNSSVIRAFYTHYPVDQEVPIEEIVSDKVAFYAHTILRGGLDMGFWNKIGNSKNIDKEKLNRIKFAQGDGVKHYNNLIPFNIWRINGPMIITCGLFWISKSKIYEGSVFPSLYIIFRMYSGYFYHSDPLFDIIKRYPRPEYTSYTELVEDGIKYLLIYIGDNLERCMVIKDKRIKIYYVEEAKVAGLKIAFKKFSDIKWRYFNFMTPSEFKERWNNAERYLESGDPEKIKLIEEVSMKSLDPQRELEFLV